MRWLVAEDADRTPTMCFCRRAAVLVALALLLTSGNSQTAAQDRPPPADLTTLAGQVELVRLVDLCSQRLGINIEYDKEVLRHNVTLRLGGGVTDAELWTLTNRLLAARDLTSIRMAGESTMSVVRLTDAARLARIESVADGGAAHAVVPAGFITVIIQLEHVGAASLVEMIKPLLSRNGSTATPLGDGDDLLISDLAPRVEEIRSIITRIDVPRAAPEVELIDTVNVPAERLVTLVTAAANTWSSTSGRTLQGRLSATGDEARAVLIAPGDELEFWRDLIDRFDTQQPVETRTYITPPAVTALEVRSLIEDTAREETPRGSGDQWKIVANEVTGTLIITATPSEHARVQELLIELDVPLSATRTQMRSFRVRNRDVGELLQVLSSLLELGLPVGEPPPSTARATPVESDDEAPASHLPLMSSTSGELTLTADSQTNTLIAIGPPRLIEQVAVLLDDLDVRQPQVMIEAMVLSLNEGDTFDLGVELQKLEASGETLIRLSSLFGLSSITVDDVSTAAGGPGFTGVALNPGDFSIVLRALQTLNDGRSMNVPKVLVNNNAQALLDAVVQQPFTSTNASDTVATTSFGGFENAGTSITVTPRIAQGDHLILEYSITLSAFVGESASPSAPPPRQQNTLQSEVTIPDGYTIVLGGLEITTEADAISQVPILGAIPGVGELFKSRSKSVSRSRFFVFIRANVLRQNSFEALKYLSDQAAGASEFDESLAGWPEVKPRIIR